MPGAGGRGGLQGVGYGLRGDTQAAPLTQPGAGRGLALSKTHLTAPGPLRASPQPRLQGAEWGYEG